MSFVLESTIPLVLHSVMASWCEIGAGSRGATAIPNEEFIQLDVPTFGSKIEISANKGNLGK